MRKWRPTHKCLYVIPEIHGEAESFKIILNRILPLRFSVNQEDTVVMLGDYIDKGSRSCDVVELLIELKKEYGDNLVLLKGNHEQLFLNAFQSEENYRHWLMQGGMQTLQSYLDNAQIKSTSQFIPFSRLADIIPKEHIKFIESLPSHKELDDYIFFHGGFNTIGGIENTSENTFIYDTWASQSVKQALASGQRPFEGSKKIYVGSHNFKDNFPFIYANYFMLGGSAPRQLILFELNSMTCAMIKSGKSRIYKHKFKFVE
jgi:hypothetical protein